MRVRSRELFGQPCVRGYRGKLGGGVYPTARRDQGGAGAVAAGFAANGVILNPRITPFWAAGFPDAATVLVNVWTICNIGSPAHLGLNETGGNTMMPGVIFGNGQGAGVTAETNTGMEFLFDNSPNNPARWNIADSALTPANEATKSHINVVIPNPQDGNNKLVCWTLAADISAISGTTARGAVWRTIYGQAPVKVQDGLPILNGNPTWTNGGAQKINLANVLGFYINANNTQGGGWCVVSEFWIGSPPSGFLDASNNLVVGLSKFVTAGGKPVDQGPAGTASGLTPLCYLSGDRSSFLTDKSARAISPTIPQTTLRSHPYNAPVGPGQTPDRPYLVAGSTHFGLLPTTNVLTYTPSQLLYGSEILVDDGLLITVRVENSNTFTDVHHPTVTAASGAAYAAIEVPNSRQKLDDAVSREIETVQYLIRMGARDATAAGTDYGFPPRFDWTDSGTQEPLFNTSLWQASLVRGINWANPIDTSQSSANVPATGLQCPSVIPSVGPRLVVYTWLIYDTNANTTDAGAPVNAGQELWRDDITVSGGGPMITYEKVTGDGATPVGVRIAQFSGTSRVSVGITTVF